MPALSKIVLAGAALVALGAAAPAEAASGYRALCSGAYCFHVSNFSKSRTIDNSGPRDIWFYMTFGGLKPTHYNIRFRTADGRTVQHEIDGEGARSAIKSFPVKPGHVYSVSTQACTRQFLGRSQCTGWYTTRFTAPTA